MLAQSNSMRFSDKYADLASGKSDITAQSTYSQDEHMLAHGYERRRNYGVAYHQRQVQ